MNVEIFALYMILSRNWHFLNIRENMYNMKNNFIFTQRASDPENANLNPSEIGHFLKSAIIYTHKKYLRSQ